MLVELRPTVEAECATKDVPLIRFAPLESVRFGRVPRPEDRPPTTYHQQLESKKISKEHATISISSAGIITLTDLSTNGVYVNGKQVGLKQSIELVDGDVITFSIVPKVMDTLPSYRVIVVHDTVPLPVPRAGFTVAGAGSAGAAAGAPIEADTAMVHAMADALSTAAAIADLPSESAAATVCDDVPPAPANAAGTAAATDEDDAIQSCAAAAEAKAKADAADAGAPSPVAARPSVWSIFDDSDDEPAASSAPPASAAEPSAAGVPSSVAEGDSTEGCGDTSADEGEESDASVAYDDVEALSAAAAAPSEAAAAATAASPGRGSGSGCLSEPAEESELPSPILDVGVTVDLTADSPQLSALPSPARPPAKADTSSSYFAAAAATFAGVGLTVGSARASQPARELFVVPPPRKELTEDEILEEARASREAKMAAAAQEAAAQEVAAAAAAEAAAQEKETASRVAAERRVAAARAAAASTASAAAAAASAAASAAAASAATADDDDYDDVGFLDPPAGGAADELQQMLAQPRLRKQHQATVASSTATAYSVVAAPSTAPLSPSRVPSSRRDVVELSSGNISSPVAPAARRGCIKGELTRGAGRTTRGDDAVGLIGSFAFGGAAPAAEMQWATKRRSQTYEERLAVEKAAKAAKARGARAALGGRKRAGGGASRGAAPGGKRGSGKARSGRTAARGGRASGRKRRADWDSDDEDEDEDEEGEEDEESDQSWNSEQEAVESDFDVIDDEDGEDDEVQVVSEKKGAPKPPSAAPAPKRARRLTKAGDALGSQAAASPAAMPSDASLAPAPKRPKPSAAARAKPQKKAIRVDSDEEDDEDEAGSGARKGQPPTASNARTIVARSLSACEAESRRIESALADISGEGGLTTTGDEPRDMPSPIDRPRGGSGRLLQQPKLLGGAAGMLLKDYQLVGLNWLWLMWRMKGGGILADEMGLGKTIQVIALLCAIKEHGGGGGEQMHHLVVAPASTLDNWVREFAAWAPSLVVVKWVPSNPRPLAPESTFPAQLFRLSPPCRPFPAGTTARRRAARRCRPTSTLRASTC